MFKKIITVLISITLVLSLMACGSNKNNEKMMSEIANVYDFDDSEYNMITFYKNGTWENTSKKVNRVVEKGTWWIKKIEDEYVLIERSYENMQSTVMDKYSRLDHTILWMGHSDNILRRRYDVFDK